MNILMTGGTGFIGAKLSHALMADGHDLTVLSRKPEKVPELCGAAVKGIGRLDMLGADTHFDAIINLAGEPIIERRWTEQRKRQLLDSRIGVTEQLIAYIARAQQKPAVLISGSAIGYYGDQGDRQIHEHSVAHDEFGHRLCLAWEYAALKAENYGVRVCIIRTGLVIGRGGGFLQSMLLPFRLGLGGRLGNGKQWMSWIHRDDYISIFRLLLTSPQLQGVFNGTAPCPVTNAEFTGTLARLLHRPALFAVPETAIKLLFGEMSELMLGGQRVLPIRLQQAGFSFKYPRLEEALREALDVRTSKD